VNDPVANGFGLPKIKHAGHGNSHRPQCYKNRRRTAGRSAVGCGAISEIEGNHPRRAFPPILESGEHFINPCCFGEDLAAWLRSRLAEKNVHAGTPYQEDWGWELPVTLGGEGITWV
jgi:hypothetical protein